MKKELFRLIVGDIFSSDSPWTEIKKWRKALKIKSKDIAQRINVSPSVISDYESGRRKSPGLYMIKKIVRAIVDIFITSDSYDDNSIQKKIEFEKLSSEIGGTIMVHPTIKTAEKVVIASRPAFCNCDGACVITDIPEAVLLFSMLSVRPNFFVVNSLSDVEKAIARKYGFGVIIADIKKAKNYVKSD